MMAPNSTEQLAALEKEEAALLAKIGNRKQTLEERRELDRLDDAIKAASGEVARDWVANHIRHSRK